MKGSFEQVLQSMSHFLNFPDIESEIDKLIEESVKLSLLPKSTKESSATHDVLADYLSEDPNQKKLKMVVAMAGGSLEKLKRVIASIFEDATLESIRTNEVVRTRVAKFLVAPSSESSFIPNFIRKSFSLPKNWIGLLEDTSYLSVVARQALSATYSAKMGFRFEKCVGDIVSASGLTYEKGPVAILDNKEVDIAIPNRTEPKVLIMISYQVTTGSGQSTKANEQRQMYNMIQSLNRSRSQRYIVESAVSDRMFVNVVDGGGWIARQRDLHQLWLNSDYFLTFNTLAKLESIIRKAFFEQFST